MEKLEFLDLDCAEQERVLDAFFKLSSARQRAYLRDLHEHSSWWQTRGKWANACLLKLMEGMNLLLLDERQDEVVMPIPPDPCEEN